MLRVKLVSGSSARVEKSGDNNLFVLKEKSKSTQKSRKTSTAVVVIDLEDDQNYDDGERRRKSPLQRDFCYPLLFVYCGDTRSGEGATTRPGRLPLMAVTDESLALYSTDEEADFGDFVYAEKRLGPRAAPATERTAAAASVAAFLHGPPGGRPRKDFKHEYSSAPSSSLSSSLLFPDAFSHVNHPRLSLSPLAAVLFHRTSHSIQFLRWWIEPCRGRRRITFEEYVRRFCWFN